MERDQTLIHRFQVRRNSAKWAAMALAPGDLIAMGTPAGVASYAVFNESAGAVRAQMLPPSAADVQLRTSY
jgi:hypothetical protein